MSVEKTINLQQILTERLHSSEAAIVDFCKKWNIIEFSLFGSVLRNDFHPESDVDVLIQFEPSFHLSLTHWLDMQEELETLFHRSIDLTEKTRLNNPYRRAEVLRTHQVIYANE